MHGAAPRKKNRKVQRKALASLQRDRLQLAVVAVETGDLAAVTDDDAGLLELAHEVVGHRLAEVAAAMQERHERASFRQPDGGLPGRVAAADHADARGSAHLRLRWPGRVERADPFVLVELRRAGGACTAHRSRAGLRTRRSPVTFLEPDAIAAVQPPLERLGAVRRRRPGVELASPRDGTARQLGAADPGRKAEVVLDPP